MAIIPANFLRCLEPFLFRLFFTDLVTVDNVVASYLDVCVGSVSEH